MKSILYITVFCLALMTLGCQTLTSKTASHDQFGCAATAPEILSLRYPASSNKLSEAKAWLNTVSTSHLVDGSKEYIVELKKELNKRMSKLNLEDPSVDMTLLSGIPDPDRRASQDKTHVIDIVFLYPSDEENTRELLLGADRYVSEANGVFEHSGVNARLRVVEVIPSSEMNAVDRTSRIELKEFMRNQLPELRRIYGADLAYVILPKVEGACGYAMIRDRGMPESIARSWASVGVVSVKEMCLRSFTLAHEVGHNLGLVHHRSSSPSGVIDYKPFVRGGKGYASPTVCKSDRERPLYGTVMTSPRPCAGIIPHFSANKTYEGQVIGSEDVNASEALLYTIEEASNYAPSVFPDDYEWQME